MYQSHPQYPEVINKILDWFKRDDYQYSCAAQELLSRISPELDVVLKHILLDFIRSGEKEKILNSTRVLEGYEGATSIYNLLREAVKCSRGDEEVKGVVKAAINQTGGGCGERGFIEAYQSRIEQLQPWLEDENQYVRNFAENLIKGLQGLIEYGEKMVTERAVIMRKGL